MKDLLAREQRRAPNKARLLRFCRCQPSIWLSVLFSVIPLAAIPVAAQSPSTQRDYAGALQRVPPRDVSGSLAAFHVKPGLRVVPLAVEPLVVDPVAISFDADGALYAVEMRGYSEDDDRHLGRIRKLVDGDNDGRFDTSWVFASGLSWPTAVTCYKGGVIVAAAPDLIFLKDTDGDHIADVRQVWFRGFGRSNVQGLVNSLQWGPDNRIHGATSSTGATLHRVTEDGDTIEPPVVQLRGRDFAIDPTTLTVTATSGGGQHGMTFNRWGEKFVCQNSNHVQQIAYADHYLQRNPFAEPPPARVNIATDGPQADVFRTSPVEAWRIIRTDLRVSGQVPGPVERGGKAAGYFTGATGIRAFHGDRLPEAFLNHLFVCDVGSNLIHRKRLIPDGVLYKAERIDPASELLTSDDIWFRPVQLSNGPEGILYVIDMYREVVEHPKSLPPMIKRHLDLASGRNRGRVWGIVTDAFEHRSQPRMSTMSDDTLVSYLAHRNGWHRQTASRLLLERHADGKHRAHIATQIRRNILRAENRSPEATLTALSLLASLEALTVDDLRDPLRHDSPRLQRWAVRLAEGLVGDAPSLQPLLIELSHKDLSPVVAQQLAFTLGELPDDHQPRNEALQTIAERHGQSQYILAAVQNAHGSSAAHLLIELTDGSHRFNETPTGLDFLRQLAAQIGRQQSPAEIARIGKWLPGIAEKHPETALAILPSLTRGRDNEFSRRLRRPPLKTVFAELMQRARRLAADQGRPVSQRRIAIRALALENTDQTTEVFRRLLGPRQPLSIQRSTLQAIQQQGTPAMGNLLLQRWKGYTPKQRREVVAVLLSRTAWHDSLVAALLDGQLALNELTTSERQQLRRATSPKVWQQVEQQSGLRTNDATPQQLLATYKRVLEQPADVKNGRRVFRKHCAACHRVEYFGSEVGPNLTTMQNRGADAILSNVLMPNQEVNPQYLSYNAILTDGRIVNGMIRSETATSIELIQADNRSHTLLRTDIEQLTNSGQSLMPTGIQQEIPPADMNDLIGYLLNAD